MDRFISQMIKDGKIPADYEPKEVTFETK